MHPIDDQLSDARQRRDDHAQLFKAFSALGREIAAAEAELAATRGSAAAPDRQGGRRGWRRAKSPAPHTPTATESEAALADAVQLLRDRRNEVSSQYQALGSAEQDYHALLDQKILVLGESHGPEIEQVRQLLMEQRACRERAAALEPAVAAGNQAQAAVLRVVNQIGDLVPDAKGMVGLALASSATMVDKALDAAEVPVLGQEASICVIRFSEQLLGLGAAPLTACVAQDLTQVGSGWFSLANPVHREVTAAVGWLRDQLNETRHQETRLKTALRSLAESLDLPV
ncbi:MAG: hypothetical protein ACKV2O_05805 [Acidimicrobiales bacterium]